MSSQEFFTCFNTECVPWRASSSSLITHYLQQKWQDLHLCTFSSVNVCTCLNYSIIKAAGRAAVPLLLKAGSALKPHQLLRDLPSSDLENAGMERRHNLSMLPILLFGREQPSWGRAFPLTQPEISPARVHVCCQLVRGLSASTGPDRVKFKTFTSVCFAFSSFLPFNWILCLRCSIHTSGSWLIHIFI